MHKVQIRNPIFQISYVDILDFSIQLLPWHSLPQQMFPAFTCNSLGKTMSYNEKTGSDMGRVYSRDQTFFSHKASHNASLKNPKKKVTPLLIPYGRFSKVIIYYLASNNNIHQRPDSAVHHTGDDYILGNLKFVPKGESVEVFGMTIPDPLITEAIQQSSYYPKYLQMVAENTKKNVLLTIQLRAIINSKIHGVTESFSII
ncbi:hypothetical protein Tco_0501708 [Tanacetum coccineum]